MTFQFLSFVFIQNRFVDHYIHTPNCFLLFRILQPIPIDVNIVANKSTLISLGDQVYRYSPVHVYISCVSKNTQVRKIYLFSLPSFHKQLTI